jgi:hypothetical protein
MLGGRHATKVPERILVVATRHSYVNICRAWRLQLQPDVWHVRHAPGLGQVHMTDYPWLWLGDWYPPQHAAITYLKAQRIRELDYAEAMIFATGGGAAAVNHYPAGNGHALCSADSYRVSFSREAPACTECRRLLREVDDLELVRRTVQTLQRH